jgi:hypothetical protein
MRLHRREDAHWPAAQPPSPLNGPIKDGRKRAALPRRRTGSDGCVAVRPAGRALRRA